MRQTLEKIIKSQNLFTIDRVFFILWLVTGIGIVTACNRSTNIPATNGNSASATTDFETFYAAAQKDDTNEMNRLLAGGLSTTTRDKHGDLLIHGVSAIGKPTAVTIVLDHSADINALDRGGNTALGIAVTFHQPGVVKLLLDRGADVNAGKVDAPLYVVQDAELCELLIAHGADVNGRTHTGETPLDAAAEAGYSGVVTALLNAGANVQSVNSSGNTAVLDAAEAAQWDCVKILVERGGNLTEKNIRDQNKTTLHYAAIAHKLGLIKLLLAHGASREAKDTHGKTPLDYAQYGGWKGNDADAIFRLLGPS
jgi:ankyrin repeat protein